jgi:hypothetical protein
MRVKIADAGLRLLAPLAGTSRPKGTGAVSFPIICPYIKPSLAIDPRRLKSCLYF